MQATTAPNSNARRWTSLIVSGLPVAFLLLDGTMKLFKPAVVIETTTKLGYAESIILPLGVTLLICTIAYLVPRTAMLGAILLTGYLGGAVNTHVRAWEGWFPVFFPVVIGAMLWGGLYLRESRLAALLPLTMQAPAATKKMFWGGWAMSAVPLLLLLSSAVMKLIQHPQVVGGFVQLGYSQRAVVSIGVVELLCIALYLVPRTAVFGAILLDGYMGGALSTHLRVGETFLVQALVGVLIWGGLYLRDERLRALIPFRA